MGLTTLLDLWVSVRDHASIGIIIVVIFLSCIQVSKINWNPWDVIFGWVGDKLNSGVKKEVQDIKKQLDAHVAEYEKEKLENTRRDILDFCNSCMRGQKHTQEQFRFVIKKCDHYETYIEEHKIKNGEISSAIEEIRRLYTLCIQNHSFLTEGETSNN